MPVRSRPEIYRVAERYGLKVFVVANSFMAVPRSDMIERVIVSEGADVADDWIVERVTENDIVITADIPLAGRCVRKGATVIGPTGKPFTEDSIGMALATRDLLTDLRSAGATTRGPPPLSAAGYFAVSVGARSGGDAAEAEIGGAVILRLSSPRKRGASTRGR